MFKRSIRKFFNTNIYLLNFYIKIQLCLVIIYYFLARENCKMLLSAFSIICYNFKLIKNRELIINHGSAPIFSKNIL